jgi:hypothetical protein
MICSNSIILFRTKQILYSHTCFVIVVVIIITNNNNNNNNTIFIIIHPYNLIGRDENGRKRYLFGNQFFL